MALRSFWLLVICFALSCATPLYAQQPEVIAGLIDLTDWDFEADGRVQLTGDYEFYWQQHLDSQDFLSIDSTDPELIYVPATWNDKEINGQPIGGFGYATYRLNILVSTQETLALKLPDFGTAFKVYIDGKEKFSAGMVGTSEITSAPRYRTGITQFVPRSNRVELIVQVSNFDHRLGGAWLPIYIGTPEELADLREDQLARDFILFGATLIIGLYNIVLFAMRRENRSSLYLGLFCLLVATRQLLVGDRFATEVLEGVSYASYVKLEYLGWYLAGSAFVAFMNNMFPREFHRYATWGLHAAFIAGALVVLVAPIHISSQMVPAFQLVTIVALGYGLTGLLLASTRKREGAVILLVAYGLLFGAIVSDILVNAGISNNILILDMGLFVFVLFQSILVSYRFTQSFNTITRQRTELEATNLKLRTQEKLRRDAESASEALHERILESEKMEAIGLLAGGVAHDLNNILSTTVTYSELALLDLEEDSPMTKPLQLTRQAGLRAAAVIEDMLTLARRGVVSRDVINLNTVVTDYFESVEYKLMHAASPKVQVETHLGADLNNIKGSVVHLQKLLMNMITNSIEAQGSEGKVFVTTENQQVEEKQLFFQKLTAGNYVVLSIEDEGAGIEPDDLEKLFEPFYTTKVMGQSGTGLGMSVVWGVVYDHDGVIDVVSELGVGTRFDIYLPSTTEQLTVAESTHSNILGNKELILVIDDMPDQRELTQAVLERLNYSVVVCASGSEALEVIKQQPVALALIDMVMGDDWNGLETYKQLIAVKPALKTILISGFAETDQVLEAQALGAGAFQRKPFTIDGLGRKILDSLST